MSDCNTVATPMESKIKLSKADAPKTKEEMEQMKSVPYQEAIGCLMYLACSTRPDIQFSVNKLSQFSSNPGQTHWTAVKHLLRYLNWKIK